MKKSIVSIVVLIILMLSFGGGAYAQGPVPCGDLDAADCAILEASQEAMVSLSAVDTEGLMSMFVGGIPDAPISEVGIEIAVSSTSTADPEIQA